MGVPWHKKEEKAKKEWVIYGAAGVVLLLVAGGVTLGVVLGNKASNKSSGDSQQQASAQGSTPEAGVPLRLPPPVAAPASSPPPPAPTPAPAPIPAPIPVATPPPAAGTPTSAPAPVPATPALPLAASPPPPPTAVPASPPPPAPAAIPAPTAAPITPTTTTSTYNPAVVAPGTLTGPPNGRTSESYPPPEIRAGKEGTCELQTNRQFKCNDDMDYGSSNIVPIENLQLMHDAQQMEACGFVDMTQIVNGLVKWAYKEKCGIEAFTISRACIGKAGIADGYWRSRVMLWPVAGGDPTVCVPLCIKMRGLQNTVTEYGRTAGC